jgi:hypothetical protein
MVVNSISKYLHSETAKYVAEMVTYGDVHHAGSVELYHYDLHKTLRIILAMGICSLFVFENNRSTGVG